MASSENSSPLKFLGKPWSVWATYALNETSGVTSPVEISHADLGNPSPESNTSVPSNEDDANVMKLKIEDKPMFGICPMRDECYLVFCNKCEQVVKSQAMTKHYQLRHGRPPDRSPEPVYSPIDYFPSSSNFQPSIPSPLERLHPLEGVTLSPAPEIRTESEPSHRKHQLANPEPLPDPLPDPETTSAIASIEEPPPLELPPPPPLPIPLPVELSPPPVDEEEEELPLPSPQLSSINLITEQYQISTAGKSPLNHMLPVTKSESPSPRSASPAAAQKPPVIRESKGKPVAPSLSPASSTTSSSSKPKKSSRKRKSSGIKNEKNIPCKDRQFDPNKHCGVWIEDTERPCTHSLTCKTHPLASRRAVKGRRASFNELLAAHKKITDAERAIKLQQRESSTSPKQGGHNSAKSDAIHKKGSSDQPKCNVVLNSSVPQKRPQTSANGHLPSASISRLGELLQESSAHPSPHIKATKVAVGGGKNSSGQKKEASSNKSNPGPKTPSHRSEQLYAGHPLPSTMCTFGAKKAGDCRHVFNRKMAPLRKAFLCLLEQQMNPQAAATSKKQSRSIDSKHSVKIARQLSAPAKSQSVSNLIRASTAPEGSKLSDNIFRGSSKSLKRPASDLDITGKTHNKINQAAPQLPKSKARRKSMPKMSKGAVAAAPQQSITLGNSTQNLVSVVPGNGLQAIDLPQGLYSIDASQEIPASVWKNLRLVVTNIEAAGAAGGQGNPQGGVAVPILSTVGGTQLVIGNMGGTVVPHDGKMNIKSRPKQHVVTNPKIAVERQRRPSSGQSQQHVIVPNQYVISTEARDQCAGQSIIIPTVSAASPAQVYKQNSSSAQVQSSLPNGIIANSNHQPQPQQVYALKSLPANCEKNSSSRNSTPSPCTANSTEPSPVGGLHTQYASGIQSANNSSSKTLSNSQQQQQQPNQQQLQNCKKQHQQSVSLAAAAAHQIQLQPLQFQAAAAAANQLSRQINIIDASGKAVPILSSNPSLFPSLSFQQQSGGVGGSQVVQVGSQGQPALPQGPSPSVGQGAAGPMAGGQATAVVLSSNEVR